MAMMLLKHEATVSICHVKTRDLAQYTILADILVVATGKPQMITAPMRTSRTSSMPRHCSFPWPPSSRAGGCSSGSIDLPKSWSRKPWKQPSARTRNSSRCDWIGVRLPARARAKFTWALTRNEKRSYSSFGQSRLFVGVPLTHIEMESCRITGVLFR